MNHVFGPVPSRRLGQSLGVDPVPLKTCNWNCVYCQLGRSRPMVNVRKDYIPCDDLAAEVELALESHEPGTIDWVTIVGSGEPLLHSHIGNILKRIKHLTTIPVALITNGSLLYDPDVRAAIRDADAVMPSLDAGTPELYRRINRPHPRITYERLIEGLIAFRREYTGNLWVEVMLIGGVNDSEEALRDLANQLTRVEPSEVHINLPTRPPAERWLEPPSDEALMRAVAMFEEIAPVRAVTPVEGTFEVSAADSLADAILAVVTRHPLRRAEIEQTLVKFDADQVRSALTELEATGRAQVVSRYGKRFWTAAESYYGA